MTIAVHWGDAQNGRVVSLRRRTVGPPPYSGMVNYANPASMDELLRLDLDITQGTQSRYYLFLAPSLLIGRYLTWASFTTQASRKL
jgi:hypothetical protein